MDNATYITLSRQSGLLDQLDVIATNVSNADTTGYRREATVFSEYVKAVGGGSDSISMSAMRTRFADTTQGVLQATGGELDVGLEGDGYFMVDTPNGLRLTRAGSFTTDVNGALISLDGDFVLDEGGGQIFIPPDAGRVLIAPDGTISTDEQQIGRLGIVTVSDPASLRHAGGVLLIADEAPIAADNARAVQGFLESSNVDPLREITKLIEVQRSYELGQTLIDRENERAERMIRTIGQSVG